MKSRLFIIAPVIFICQSSHAGASMDDVRFFSHFHRDAAVSNQTYADGTLAYLNHDKPDFDATVIQIQGGVPVSDTIEVGFGTGYADLDFKGSDESGLLDLELIGKYQLSEFLDYQVTVGGSVTLPVGEKDIGQDNTNYGVFGAIRHPLNEQLVVMGSAGVNAIETGGRNRDASLHLGAGFIYELYPVLHLTGELQLETETDVLDLTAGIDYAVDNFGNLRGALVLGLDDGSPDYGFQVGYLLRF